MGKINPLIIIALIGIAAVLLAQSPYLKSIISQSQISLSPDESYFVTTLAVNQKDALYFDVAAGTEIPNSKGGKYVTKTPVRIEFIPSQPYWTAPALFAKNVYGVKLILGSCQTTYKIGAARYTLPYSPVVHVGYTLNIYQDGALYASYQFDLPQNSSINTDLIRIDNFAQLGNGYTAPPLNDVALFQLPNGSYAVKSKMDYDLKLPENAFCSGTVTDPKQGGGSFWSCPNWDAASCPSLWMDVLLGMGQYAGSSGAVGAPQGFGYGVVSDYNKVSDTQVQVKGLLPQGSFSALTQVWISKALTNAVYYMPPQGIPNVLDINAGTSQLLATRTQLTQGLITTVCSNIRNDANAAGSFTVSATVSGGVGAVPLSQKLDWGALETKKICFTATGGAVGSLNPFAITATDSWSGQSSSKTLYIDITAPVLNSDGSVNQKAGVGQKADIPIDPTVDCAKLNTQKQQFIWDANKTACVGNVPPPNSIDMNTLLIVAAIIGGVIVLAAIFRGKRKR